MKVKRVWFDATGTTLIEKELVIRLCSNEKSPCFEIMLTENESDYPQEAIFIDYEELLKRFGKRKKK